MIINVIIITSAASTITNTFSYQNAIVGHAEKGRFRGTKSLSSISNFLDILIIAILPF